MITRWSRACRAMVPIPAWHEPRLCREQPGRGRGKNGPDHYRGRGLGTGPGPCLAESEGAAFYASCVNFWRYPRINLNRVHGGGRAAAYRGLALLDGVPTG